jgi:hypothetical protein
MSIDYWNPAFTILPRFPEPFQEKRKKTISSSPSPSPALPKEREKLLQFIGRKIAQIAPYPIEKLVYEEIDGEISIGVKFRNFPPVENKIAYGLYLMGALSSHLPKNMEVWVI